MSINHTSTFKVFQQQGDKLAYIGKVDVGPGQFDKRFDLARKQYPLVRFPVLGGVPLKAPKDY